MSNNKVLVEQLFNELMNQKNMSSVEKYLDPNFKQHGFPNSKQGIEGFKEILGQFTTAFPDFKVVPESIIVEGDLVATRGYCTGTNTGSFMGGPATNKKVTISYIDWWQFKNGKAVENWVQLDMQAMLAQLGLVPAQETA